MSIVPGLVERYEQQIKALNENMKTLEKIGGKTLDKHRTKWCSRCEDPRPLKEFNERARSKDGLQAWCKPCNKAYHKDKRRQRKEMMKALEKELAAIKADRQPPQIGNASRFDSPEPDQNSAKGMAVGIIAGLLLWLGLVALVWWIL